METITVQEHTDVCPRTCTYFGCEKCFRRHKVAVERPIITLKECAERLGLTVDWDGSNTRADTLVIFNDHRHSNHWCGGEVLYVFSSTYVENGRRWPSGSAFGLVQEPGRVVAVAFV